MANMSFIFLWISFAISTFAIKEEISSVHEIIKIALLHINSGVVNAQMIYTKESPYGNYERENGHYGSYVVASGLEHKNTIK